MGASRRALVPCLAAAALALAACDALLGLGQYKDVDCAVDCGTDAREGSTAFPEASEAADGPDAASMSDAGLDGDAFGTTADVAIPEGGWPVPTGHEIWAHWPMPNPDAAIAPDASTLLPHPMTYDAGADGGDLVAYDVVTRLTWYRQSMSAKDYGTAWQACEGLNGVGWRVPTRIELVSLIDFTQPSGESDDRPGRLPVGAGPLLLDLLLRSRRRRNCGLLDRGLRVGARLDDQHRGPGPVRERRGAMTARWLRATVAATGVLALASLARADAPPDQYNLFNLNSDVIQDLWTGLSWQRYPPATSVTFDAAAAYCASLSLDTMTTGWRVPSYKELLTIVDEAPHVEYEGAQLVQKAIDGNAFPGAAVDVPYWTSSLYPAAKNNAYVVDFGNGGVPGPDAIVHSDYVRCVH